jgi:hypothetical protein
LAKPGEQEGKSRLAGRVSRKVSSESIDELLALEPVADLLGDEVANC